MDKFLFNKLCNKYSPIITKLINQNIKFYRFHETIRWQFGFDERVAIEFKAIKGNNPCKSILSVVDQYIVSFLNSPYSNEGIIKWGIDDDGKVIGVKLNKKQRDEIRKGIQCQINNILPPLTSNICDLQFQVILNDNNNIIEDLYIVELKVRHKFSKNLYSTGKGEVFIKRDGVKQKLNPYQIQLEAVQRNK